jgi:hypothetical protein
MNSLELFRAAIGRETVRRPGRRGAGVRGERKSRAIAERKP